MNNIIYSNAGNKFQGKRAIAIINDVEEITDPLNQTFPIDIEDVKTYSDYQKLSKYPGLHLQNQTRTKSYYTIFTSFPIAESEAINDSIQSWLKQTTKTCFLKKC